METAYPDQIGLVTVGLGFLADPLSLMLAMPWRRLDGLRATNAEVSAEYRRVKSLVIPPGASRWRTAAKTATIRLTKADGANLVIAKLTNNEAHVRQILPSWDSLPARAQLAVMSWAWAVGPAAKFPRMFAALAAGDYCAAAKECRINPDVDTIHLRNQWNRVLLEAAAEPGHDVSTIGFDWKLVAEARQ